MFFTAEDYQNIAKYLRNTSYKDTDFPPLYIGDLIDEDIFTLVHNDTNYSINYGDLRAQLTQDVTTDYKNYFSQSDLVSAYARYNVDDAPVTLIFTHSNGEDLSLDLSIPYLFNGVIPQKFLPTSFISMIETYPTYSALPQPGATPDEGPQSDILYIVTDTGYQYRWTGTTYIKVMEDVSQVSIELSAMKAKLDGIEDNANNYTLPESSTTTLGGIMTAGGYSGESAPVYLDEHHGVIKAATSSDYGVVKLYDDTVITSGNKVYGVHKNENGKMVVSVPWTDTVLKYLDLSGDQPVYEPLSTITASDSIGFSFGADGFMPTLKKAQKFILGGISTGYLTNGKNYAVDVDEAGNAYVNVPWNNTITVHSEDNIYNGINILTSQGSVKFSPTGTSSVRADVEIPVADTSTVGGVYLADGKLTDTTQLGNYSYAFSTYSGTLVLKHATATVSGAMSATDKQKLDRIPANANYYVLPEAEYNTLGGVKLGNEFVKDPSGYLRQQQFLMTIKPVSTGAGAVNCNVTFANLSNNDSATSLGAALEQGLKVIVKYDLPNSPTQDEQSLVTLIEGVIPLREEGAVYITTMGNNQFFAFAFPQASAIKGTLVSLLIPANSYEDTFSFDEGSTVSGSINGAVITGLI